MQYKFNTHRVIHSISAFLPLLPVRASTANLKKIVVIECRPQGRTAWGLADAAAYGVTRATGIVMTIKWTLKLKDEGFVVVSLSPGVVDTSVTKALNDR
ncbi:hypothetical protein C8Q74DRAFT_569107 [Fomes fomentarius]|nr:hypothetical protein C8Q74DRAFT_569107 [Fomes fomentarius]